MTKEDYDGNYQRFRKLWTKEELSEALKQNNFKIEDYYETKCTSNKEWMVFTVRNY